MASGVEQLDMGAGAVDQDAAIYRAIDYGIVDKGPMIKKKKKKARKLSANDSGAQSSMNAFPPGMMLVVGNQTSVLPRLGSSSMGLVAGDFSDRSMSLHSMGTSSTSLESNISAQTPPERQLSSTYLDLQVTSVKFPCIRANQQPTPIIRPIKSNQPFGKKGPKREKLPLATSSPPSFPSSSNLDLNFDDLIQATGITTHIAPPAESQQQQYEHHHQHTQNGFNQGESLGPAGPPRHSLSNRMPHSNSSHSNLPTQHIDRFVRGENGPVVKRVGGLKMVVANGPRDRMIKSSSSLASLSDVSLVGSGSPRESQMALGRRI
jgi:hypothetical protein